MTPSTSTILVLLAGNSLGGLVKGITGFGSAIINLCIWIAATCAGLDSGSLQQAVLTECIASEVLAIPLLFMTKAHTTCDWALVVSLSIFGALGAPVGAAMLTHLPARQVEAAVGFLMLVVIVLNCRHKRASTKGAMQEPTECGKETCPCIDAAQESGSTAGKDWPVHSMNSPKQQACLDIELLAVESDPAAVLQQDITQHALVMHDSPTLAEVIECCTVPVQRSCSSSSRGSSSSSLSSEAQCICVISSPTLDWQASHDEGEQVSLLVPVGKSQQGPITLNTQQSADNAKLPAGAADTSSPVCSPSGWRDVLRRGWVWLTQPTRLASLRKMLLMGSLAGSASGVMAGLTGMGGPPVMLMFERLQVPKETVRGTNAVCNVIQVRIFAYIAMGVFSRADLTLYVVVSVGAVIGMFVGCLMAARTNQATFSRLLTMLMVLCCVLMFASAAGIAGNQAAGKHSSN